MKVIQYSENLSDVLISSGVNFSDNRGSLKKTIFGDNLIDLMGNVKELLCVTSKKNVIRGMHFQKKPYMTSKFVTCTSGSILDVFINIDKSSNQFGQIGSINLNESDNIAIYIPEGYAHGYLVKSLKATVVYLQSENYMEKFEGCINPLSLNFNWGLKKPILSKKDSTAMTFEYFSDGIF